MNLNRHAKLTVLFSVVQQIGQSLSRDDTGMNALGKVGEALESAFILAWQIEFLGNLLAETNGSRSRGTLDVGAKSLGADNGGEKGESKLHCHQ